VKALDLLDDALFLREFIGLGFKEPRGVVVAIVIALQEGGHHVERKHEVYLP